MTDRRKTGYGTRLDEMARLHGPSVIRWALSRTKHEGDALDFVQDAFERAVRKRPRFRDQEAFQRWMMKVVKNRHIDGCRSARVRAVATNVELEKLPAATQDEIPMWRRVEPGALYDCIRRLSPTLREPLLLVLDGHPGSEIARRLRISRVTVGTRTFRARNRLRTMLQSSLSA